MKRNRALWITTDSHFPQFSSPFPYLPRGNKKKNIRCNALTKEMYSKDSCSRELSIDNAETSATIASIVSS